MVQEKYLESLPFMLLAALCAELGGAFSCCLRRSRVRRSLLILFQILLTILALNIAVFVNTRLRRIPGQGGSEEFFICVNTIPTRLMLIALRVSALSVGYVIPFILLVFFHLLRLFAPSFPVKGAGFVTVCFLLFLSKWQKGKCQVTVTALRWVSWLPIHLHAVLIELGLVGRVLNTSTIIRLHQVQPPPLPPPPHPSSLHWTGGFDGDEHIGDTGDAPAHPPRPPHQEAPGGHCSLGARPPHHARDARVTLAPA